MTTTKYQNDLDLMQGVPRGLPTKYLKDQCIPQARWQKQEVIETHPALAYNPNNPQGKILIGACGDRLIGIEDNRHILTCAANRSGKSVTVIGNLLFYNGSVMVIDPKGELANKTAARRAELGQKVYVLDPFGRTRGKAKQYRAKYNPLSTLKLSNDTVIEDAMQIVDGLVVRTGQEKDPHWNDSAADALLGFVLYVAFGDNLTDDERHLGTVRRLVSRARQTQKIDEDKSGYTVAMKVMSGIQHLRESGHTDVAEAIEGAVLGFYEKSSDELASVHSTMNRQTAFLDFISMKKVLSGHDFDLRDLKRAPEGVSIYLCLPATRMGMCNRWLRLFVNQLIDAMEMEETKPRAPVLAVLDEFPVLGHMKQLEDAAGQVASFHLKLWTIIQDWSQGKAIYGERWESFAANCGVTQFFACVDLTTTEYICRRLGKTPVLTARQNDTSHDQIERGLSGKSQGKDLYDLMTPDEISRVFSRADPLKRQLVLMAGLYPNIMQRVEYFNEEAPYAHVFEGKYEKDNG